MRQGADNELNDNEKATENRSVALFRTTVKRTFYSKINYLCAHHFNAVMLQTKQLHDTKNDSNQ